MEKNPYEKNKYLEKHQRLNIPQEEIERKWRLYEEEQELMKLMMGASAPGNASAIPFISTWKTDNTSTGSSNSNQVRLPLMPNGSYNFYVNWGDGTVSSIASWNQPEATHTYAAAGTYTITITGYINGWSFAAVPPLTGATGDRLKLLTISQWGCLRFNSIITDSTVNSGAFYNCTNLTLLTVSDTPNFAGSPSTFNFFRGCTALTTINNINSWDVSGVTYFRSMFRECTNFNDNVGNWNTGKGTNMGIMFYGSTAATIAGKFNNGGSSSIGNWNTSNVTDMANMFQFQPTFNQNIGAWDVSKVTGMTSMFYGCSVAPYGLFDNGGSDSINNWNTGNVTSMSSMFTYQPNFNRDIGSWNTSKVTFMNSMFYAVPSGTGLFNKDISNWNTAAVTTMAGMFFNQANFNQEVGKWNISNVTDINSMFSCSGSTGVFNNGSTDSIKNWDTSKVTSIRGMFQRQINFNREVGLWNIGNVTDMAFFAAGGVDKAFNNGGSPSIGNWNTSKVTNMTSGFLRCNLFDQNLGAWNTGLVQTIDGLFACQGTPGIFNNGGSDTIKNWNLGNVTNFGGMFNGAALFNQPIGSWNVSKATAMGDMFISATAFNQTLADWNVSLVTAFTNFMANKTNLDYSAANYDALLIGWASRPVKPNININFNTIKRTAASTAARLILTSAPNNWTITDGGI
jgi:surface protein